VSPECDRPPAARDEPPWHVVVVGFFTLLLLTQGGISFLVRPEPYPTIRMPGFGYAPTRDGRVQVSFARLEAVDAGGATRTVAVSDVMRTFRFSAARPSFDYLFRDADPSRLSPAGRAWLRARIETLTDGFHPTQVRMCWQKSDVSVADASTMSEQSCTWKAVAL
jgi:hypothetical protein